MAITASDVKDILDTSLTDSEINAYISQAGQLVDDEQTKTWLAAHLIRISKDREAEKESVGDHSVTYSGESGLGLDSTRYGQMAQMFDTDGELPTGGKAAEIDITSW